MRRILSVLVLISIIAALSPVSIPAAQAGVNEVGVRIGTQQGSRDGDFRSYEAFANHRLPWDWRASSGWGLVPQAISSLGFLQGAGDEGVFASAGIAVVLDKNGPGFSLDIGTSPTLLNRRRFGYMDFGSTVQFVSYGGINYHFDSGLKIGYRWQHMSNGHVFYPQSNPNPGLNMHVLGISYVY